jgi:hypothetical protein
MSIDWWDTLIIGLLVLGGAGVYGIWRAARMVRAWRRAGRLVDNLADLDAYSDELEPVPDEWDDQTLAELREPDGHHPLCERTGDSCLVCEACAQEVIAASVCPGCNGQPAPGEKWCLKCISEANAEHERLPEMLYADGYPVFASLLESAAWDAHWEQAWGELQRARESAWEWYHDAARCWAGVATGTFPAVTG